jgi:hypothetical protein
MGTRTPEQLRRIIARLVRRIPKRPPAPSIRRRHSARMLA